MVSENVPTASRGAPKHGAALLAGLRLPAVRCAYETRIAEHDAAAPSAVLPPVSFDVLARDFQAVWSAPTTDARLKKRIVRTPIHDAVADIDDSAAEIVLTLHWVGGAHTEHRLPRRRRGQRTSTPADIVEAVCSLALISRDDVIAGVLNRNRLKTGYGNRWTRERVTSVRSSHHIPVFRNPPEGEELWLNLSQAAAVVVWRLEPCGSRRSVETSRRSILCPTALGSSVAST
jgi:hypothetical protein